MSELWLKFTGSARDEVLRNTVLTRSGVPGLFIMNLGVGYNVCAEGIMC
jgi:hypothetical protein